MRRFLMMPLGGGGGEGAGRREIAFNGGEEGWEFEGRDSV